MKAPERDTNVLHGAKKEQNAIGSNYEFEQCLHALCRFRGYAAMLGERDVLRSDTTVFGSKNPAAINQINAGNLTSGMRKSAFG